MLLLLSLFERLSPHQVLLLVFIKFGLTSPYDLMSQAGMSVGLTSPVLKRMKKDGLLSCTTGPRNRMRYSLTEKGEAELMASLQAGQTRHWRAGRSETFESAPRTVLLAWAYSGVDEALRCIGRTAKDLEHQAQKKEREADELRDSMLHLKADLIKGESGFDKAILAATTYRWMKVQSEATLLKSQAETISTMAPLLSDLPPAPSLLRNQESLW
jgi:DNA-binding PadR family transcriptional regulator